VTDQSPEQLKVRKERSPSFPFISLEKALERASDAYESHRREPTRLASIAVTWGYAPKSSGLLQSVAALKQYGLIEDLGSGDDRKVQLTDLARRILLDTREGAADAAIQEAARRPKVIAEYLHRWLPVRPSDAHCISELELDRGFNREAAKLFLRIFDQNVSFANLSHDDPDVIESDSEEHSENVTAGSADSAASMPHSPDSAATGQHKLSTESPIGERMEVRIAANHLRVTAVLVSTAEVDKLIDILNATKGLLQQKD